MDIFTNRNIEEDRRKEAAEEERFSAIKSKAPVIEGLEIRQDWDGGISYFHQGREVAGKFYKDFPSVEELISIRDKASSLSTDRESRIASLKASILDGTAPDFAIERAQSTVSVLAKMGHKPDLNMIAHQIAASIIDEGGM